ncbi:MAG: hypothetical protein JWN18_464 [Parcubacteria group bacterium]|nr:hypothetical protein [Parcubacteria group bacterium]
MNVFPHRNSDVTSTFKKILSVGTLVVFLSFVSANTAFAAAATYSITVNTPTIVAGAVTLSGTASVSKFTGATSSYNVAVINWGDGSPQQTGIPLSNVVISGQNFTATWTATPSHVYAASGSYTASVKLYHTGISGTDAQASKTFTVSVNHAPVVSDVSTTTITNQAKAITLVGNDVDGQALTFAVVANPTHGSVIISGNTATYTSAVAYVGADALTFKANDGSLDSNVGTVSISVAQPVNQAPTISNVPASATIPELSAYSFTATATDSDTPAQTLTFGLNGAPTGASINASSGLFSWTPTESQGPGTYSFTVSVSDGSLSRSASTTFTVAETNTAPTLSNVPASATLPELSIYSFTATATDSDTPAQTLAFSMSGAPTGAAINQSTGVFTWAPTESQGPGVYTFLISVTDGLLAKTATTTLTVVEVNTAPVATAQSISTNQGTPVQVTLVGADSDIPSQTLGYAVSTSPIHGLVSLAGTTATYTPFNNYSGSDSFVYSVNDGVTWGNQSVVTITVVPVNQSPILGGVPTGIQSVNELSVFTFTARGTDPENNALTYSLANAPTGAAINQSTGVFTWAPTELQGPGDYGFSVTVSDGSLTDTKIVSVHVTEVNVAPIAADLFMSMYPNAATSTITIAATDTDMPAQTLSYSISGLPRHGISMLSGNTLAYKPSTEYIGADYVTIAITDGVTVTTTQVTIQVGGTLQIFGVPAFNRIPESAPYAFTASSTNPNGGVLFYSLAGAPVGADMSTSTGQFTWTPTAAQGGAMTYSFTVWVDDGFNTAWAPIQLQVGTGTPNLTIPSSAAVQQFSAYHMSAYSTNPNGNALIYEFATSTPAGAMLNAQTGDFNWTPNAAQGPGIYNFPIMVHDGAEVDTETLIIEVYNNPELTVPVSVSIPTLSEYTFTATSTNPNSHELHFGLPLGAATGASINPFTGVFAWNLDQYQTAGTYYFSISVYDGAGYAEKPITIEVTQN